MLFDEPSAFEGLPESGFAVFSIEDRDRRRRAIIEAFHPSLSALGEDLIRELGTVKSEPLHAHLPRLDWPRGYQPFCTNGPPLRNAHLNLSKHASRSPTRFAAHASYWDWTRFTLLTKGRSS